MTDTDQMVGVTADGLVEIRCGCKAKSLGLEDPFAGWFLTEDGQRLVQMAQQVDAVYEEFNLARYMHTSSLLIKFAVQFDQMVFLGAGFDCRALWLNGLKDGLIRVYEVDTQAKLDQKLQEFKRHGVVVPEWNRHLVCDLRGDNLGALLQGVGMDSTKPTLVLAEGLFFYLPADVTLRVLDPHWLKLVAGSVVLFDCWSDARVKGLNKRVMEKTGRELFQQFPFIVKPEKLSDGLERLGYSRVQVTPLRNISEHYYQRTLEDEFPASWYVVEATV